MPVFTVHAPLSGASIDDNADEFVFVRDGYHFWAFLFGPLWLLWHRLWLAFVAYAVVIVGVAAVLVWLRTGVDARLAVMLLVAMLMGYEAASLRRWSYSRGHWRGIGVVVADDEEAAERRFFDQWTGGAARINRPRVGLTQPPPQSPGHSGGSHDVIGLFPQPGVPR
jgi:hypothetical protein